MSRCANVLIVFGDLLQRGGRAAAGFGKLSAKLTCVPYASGGSGFKRKLEPNECSRMST